MKALKTKNRYILLSILLLAAILMFTGLSIYSLNGDEYNSIVESTHLMTSWNATAYFGIMNLWMRVSHGVMWARLPSAIFGLLAVAVLYYIGKKMGGVYTGIAAGLMAATSPFLIYHSQEFRFYSFFILTSSLFYMATLHFAEGKKSITSLAILIITCFTIVLSHFFGVFALAPQLAVMLVAMSPKELRLKRAVIVTILFMSLSALFFIPGVSRWIWLFHQRYGNEGSPKELIVTPMGLINTAKIVWTHYIFVFGYHVYPFLHIGITLFMGMSLGLVGVVFFKGAAKLFRESRWCALPLMYVLTLLIVFFVIESVAGRYTCNGLSPRHVAFLWPIFLLIIAVGLNSFSRRVFFCLLTGIIMLNISSLWPRWTRQWSYVEVSDYRGAASFVDSWISDDTVVIHNGRSEGGVKFYFPKNDKLVATYEPSFLENLPDILNSQRCIFIVGRSLVNQEYLTDLLQVITKEYTLIGGYVEYPVFVYIFDQKKTQGYLIDNKNGQIHQPLSVYGVEFQDLDLPFKVRADNIPFVVRGAFSISNYKGNHEVDVPLSSATQGKGIVLLSNVLEAENLNAGDKIAEIIVTDDQGQSIIFPLFFGRETQDWFQSELTNTPYDIAYKWEKQFAMVGQARYSQAWRHFQAGIYASHIPFDYPFKIKNITFRYTASKGSLYIWGIAVK